MQTVLLWNLLFSNLVFGTRYADAQQLGVYIVQQHLIQFVGNNRRTENMMLGRIVHSTSRIERKADWGMAVAAGSKHCYMLYHVL